MVNHSDMRLNLCACLVGLRLCLVGLAAYGGFAGLPMLTYAQSEVQPPDWEDPGNVEDNDDIGLAGIFLKAVVKASQWFFESLICFVVALISPTILFIIDLLPVDQFPDISPLVYWFKVVNVWFPLDHAFGLLLFYWFFVVSFIICKYIWKLIPGTG